MNIVIPDDYQDAVRHLAAFQKLAGHTVTIYNDTVTDIETLAERFQDAEVLVLIRERTAITEALLARLPRLKLICQTGQGVAHIDVPACTRHGVAVAVGSGSPYAPAELTWALVLASMRHILQEVENLKAGRWQRTVGRGLHGRVLGIWGYGKIGRLVAGYGKAFGMRLLVWGREGSLTAAQQDGIESAADVHDLFRRSDVLSLHLKLVAATRDIVTPALLAEMKPSALLVNSSRAELIEAGALVSALQAGRPGYAAVDVFEQEPVTDNPLLHLENVVATPHIGYVEADGYELYFGTAFDHLLAFANGAPTGILNPEVLG
jgi:D-3-phosphoglycerate dehydrogenase